MEHACAFGHALKTNHLSGVDVPLLWRRPKAASIMVDGEIGGSIYSALAIYSAFFDNRLVCGSGLPVLLIQKYSGLTQPYSKLIQAYSGIIHSLFRLIQACSALFMKKDKFKNEKRMDR